MHYRSTVEACAATYHNTFVLVVGPVSRYEFTKNNCSTGEGPWVVFVFFVLGPSRHDRDGRPCFTHRTWARPNEREQAPTLCRTRLLVSPGPPLHSRSAAPSPRVARPGDGGDPPPLPSPARCYIPHRLSRSSPARSGEGGSRREMTESSPHRESREERASPHTALVRRTERPAGRHLRLTPAGCAYSCGRPCSGPVSIFCTSERLACGFPSEEASPRSLGLAWSPFQAEVQR